MSWHSHRRRNQRRQNQSNTDSTHQEEQANTSAASDTAAPSGEHAEQPCKISDEFARRLAQLAPDETVRALVMPTPYLRKSSDQAATRRLRDNERQALLREARQHTEASFSEIDNVLARTGGQRLTTAGNAFGYILIETNAAGIDAVSALEWVNTVMEDQSIHPQRDPRAPDRSPRAPEDRE